jgi:4-hydroxybenzoate polyprenyltransferase
MLFSILALYIHGAISFVGITLTIGIGIGYVLGFAVNDYFDRDFDKNDPSKVNKNYFVKNSQASGLAVLFALLIILVFIFSMFGVKGISILILSIFAFWSYSAKPFRFKNRPGLDLLVHGIFIETYPYIITLFLLKLNLLTIDYFILAILFSNSIINQIGQQLRDLHIDTLTETNFTIVFGQSTALLLYRALHALIVILAILGIIFGHISLTLIPPIIIISPLYIARLLSRYNQNKPHKLYVVTILLIFLYLCIIIILESLV